MTRPRGWFLVDNLNGRGYSADTEVEQVENRTTSEADCGSFERNKESEENLLGDEQVSDGTDYPP